MSDITHHINTKTGEGRKRRLARGNISCSELGIVMLVGYGKNSKTTADKLELTAQCSEMNRRSKVPTLSDRLTPLLISVGLVKGIIPTWMRGKYRAKTPDTASLPLGGVDAAGQNQDF